MRALCDSARLHVSIVPSKAYPPPSQAPSKPSEPSTTRTIKGPTLLTSFVTAPPARRPKSQVSSLSRRSPFAAAPYMHSRNYDKAAAFVWLGLTSACFRRAQNKQCGEPTQY
jgi:hypothetical protein